MPDEPKPTEAALPPINEPPKEIEVKLTTGQVYRGKTQDEVMQQLVRAQEEASRTISDLRRQPEPEPQPAPAGEFDVNQYYKLLAENPVAAQNYMLGYQLGIDPNEVVPTLRYVYDVSQRANASMQIAEFHARHPEYPGGTDSAELIFREMEGRGKRPLEATVEDLEHAYYTLRDAKKIVPLETPVAGQQPQTYAPTLGGNSGGQGADIVKDFSNLSSAQMEAYFKKAGVM